MSDTTSLYRWIIRRETHSPRSTTAIALAVVAIVLLAWLATEAVLMLVGKSPLLAAPMDAVPGLALATSVPAAILIAAGIVTAVIGILLIVFALAPGALARHHLATDRYAVVIDNEVIASSLARRAAHAGNVNPDNASVSVSHRKAEVRLVPTSGYSVDAEAVRLAVDEELQRIDAQPSLVSSIVVSRDGRV